MPSPSVALETLRPDLAQAFQQFDLEMDQRGFIATRVLPIMEVAKASGFYGVIPAAQILANRDTLRAPGAGYARGEFKFTKDTYVCDEHGAEEPIDRREAEMYREFFDAELVSAARAFDAVLRNAEKRVAAAIFNATTWTPTAITNEWDDLANATPITDILTAKNAMWAASGIWPNALIINRLVFNNLREVASIVDRLKYSGIDDPKNITAQMLAQLFDLEELIVAGSAKNTAAEGQTLAVAPIWSNEYAMLCRVARTNDMREVCIGRTMHWAEDGSMAGGTVETYYEPQTRGDVVRVRHDVDEKVTYALAGHLLSNITT